MTCCVVLCAIFCKFLLELFTMVTRAVPKHVTAQAMADIIGDHIWAIDQTGVGLTSFLNWSHRPGTIRPSEQCLEAHKDMLKAFIVLDRVPSVITCLKVDVPKVLCYASAVPADHEVNVWAKTMIGIAVKIVDNRRGYPFKRGGPLIVYSDEVEKIKLMLKELNIKNRNIGSGISVPAWFGV